MAAIAAAEDERDECGSAAATAVTPPSRSSAGPRACENVHERREDGNLAIKTEDEPRGSPPQASPDPV